MSSAVYEKILSGFCKELSATFPEISSQSDRALSTTPAQFLNSWANDLHILRDRNRDQLFSQRKGLLVGTVRLTPELFAEASEATVSAIWKYLRTLLLESAKIEKIDSLHASHPAASGILFEILTEEKLGFGVSGSGSGSGSSDDVNYEKLKQMMDDFKPLLDKLKGMMSQFLSGDSDFQLDLSGLTAGFLNLSGFALPKIPAHLLSGHIANLAKDLMKQFQPSDFGIDPSIMECEDVDEIVEKLSELFKNDTSAILAGVRRLTEKVKNKIMSGSVRQAELVAEAKEFVAIFQENPLVQECMVKAKAYFSDGAGKDIDVSSILDKFGLKGLGGIQGITEMIQTFLNGATASSSSNSGAPSDRRRAVQERLRKKLAKKNEDKDKAKATGQR